jgi:alkaline phosphatase D
LIDITGEVLYQKIMSPFQEPITSNPVFVQSGEISSDSAVINMRCNNEIEGQDVVVSYSCENVPGVENVLVGGASASADYAKTVELTGLEPNTVCTYSVTCGSDFAMGSFKTAPEDDAEQEVSFVWAADLAGQGWGRSPDLSITTADGETITGGYVIFEIMRRMNPDFALFQGDMIYAGESLQLIWSNKSRVPVCSDLLCTFLKM